MQQQPLTHTLSTREFFSRFNSPTEDDRKLNARDVMMMVAQVAVVLAVCWAIHTAFA